MTDDPTLSAPAGLDRGGRGVRFPTAPREPWSGGPGRPSRPHRGERARHHRRSGQGHRRLPLHAASTRSSWRSRRRSSPPSGRPRRGRARSAGPATAALATGLVTRSSCARSRSPRPRRRSRRTGSTTTPSPPTWLVGGAYNVGTVTRLAIRPQPPVPDRRSRPVVRRASPSSCSRLATGILIYAIARRTMGGVAAAAGLYLWAISPGPALFVVASRASISTPCSSSPVWRSRCGPSVVDGSAGSPSGSPSAWRNTSGRRAS